MYGYVLSQESDCLPGLDGSGPERMQEIKEQHQKTMEAKYRVDRRVLALTLSVRATWSGSDRANLIDTAVSESTVANTGRRQQEQLGVDVLILR